MKQIALMIAVVALATACSTTPPGAPAVAWKTIEIKNGCRVNAEGYKAAYAAAQSQRPWFWARVLTIQFNALPRAQRTGPNAHAICMVQWNDEIWAYDNEWGSSLMTRDLKAKNDPHYLAERWLAKAGRRPFIRAFFAEETAIANKLEELDWSVIDPEGEK
jgi:hypothetical protein